MPSTKKQRGKQRRAATRLASTNADLATADALMDGIQLGDDYITHSAVCKIVKRKNPILVGLLIDKGLLDVLLGFLRQCENVEVGDVETGIDRKKIKDSANNLFGAKPVWWTALAASTTVDYNRHLLSEQKTKMCRIRLAKAIGPIVSCICGSSEVFFKSKEHWSDSLCSFVSLISFIVGTQDSIAILLQYDGLVDFIVQSMFFDVYRPDVLADARITKFDMIFEQAEDIINAFIELCIDENNTRRIWTIATTPVVTCEDDNNISFVVALVNRQKHRSYYLLSEFVNAGCVDKDVITGLIDLARNSPDYKAAMIISGVIYDALAPVTEGVMRPLDNFMAFAIDKGLISVCLELLVRFGRGPEKEILTKVEVLVEAALGISLSCKTFKAVARQRSSLIEAFQCAELHVGKSNQKSQGILRRVRKIVLFQRDIENYISSTDKCDNCKKSLSKAEANQCGGCFHATYCSRKCQQKHWFKHRHLCKNIANIETTTSDTKTKKREKARARNVHAVVDKLMAENWMNVLAEATLLGYDIEECVVVINLICSPSAAVMQIADLSAEEKLSLEDLDIERSKGGLASICYPDSFCGLVLYSDEHWLAEFGWKGAQMRYKNGEFTDDTTEMKTLEL